MEHASVLHDEDLRPDVGHWGEYEEPVDQPNDADDNATCPEVQAHALA